MEQSSFFAEPPSTKSDGQAVLLSISQISNEFGHERKTVAHKLQEANIKAAGKRGGYDVYRLRDAVKALYYSKLGDGDDLPPSQRLAHYKAESEKIEVDLARGALIRRGEYERDLSDILKQVKEAFDTLPDKLEREGMSPMVCETVELHCDYIREKLYTAISGITPDDQLRP